MCISLSFCLVSIRSTWRVRRRSHGNRRRSDTTPEKSPIRDVPQSVERPHQANVYTIPERYKSQRGRAREPPVIIGDPTDTNVLAQESRRRTSSRTSVRQIEDATPKSSRHSTRRSIHGSGDIPSSDSWNLRIIPVIPQEDSEDILLLTASPHDSQPSPSRPRSHPHTPTRTLLTMEHPSALPLHN